MKRITLMFLMLASMNFQDGASTWLTLEMKNERTGGAMVEIKANLYDENETVIGSCVSDSDGLCEITLPNNKARRVILKIGRLDTLYLMVGGNNPTVIDIPFERGRPIIPSHTERVYPTPIIVTDELLTRRPTGQPVRPQTDPAVTPTLIPTPEFVVVDPYQFATEQAEKEAQTDAETEARPTVAVIEVVPTTEATEVIAPIVDDDNGRDWSIVQLLCVVMYLALLAGLIYWVYRDNREGGS